MPWGELTHESDSEFMRAGVFSESDSSVVGRVRECHLCAPRGAVRRYSQSAFHVCHPAVPQWDSYAGGEGAAQRLRLLGLLGLLVGRLGYARLGYARLGYVGVVLGRGLVCEACVLCNMNGEVWLGGAGRLLRIKSFLPEPTTKSIRREQGI